MGFHLHSKEYSLLYRIYRLVVEIVEVDDDNNEKVVGVVEIDKTVETFEKTVETDKTVEVVETGKTVEVVYKQDAYPLDRDMMNMN